MTTQEAFGKLIQKINESLKTSINFETIFDDVHAYIREHPCNFNVLLTAVICINNNGTCSIPDMQQDEYIPAAAKIIIEKVTKADIEKILKKIFLDYCDLINVVNRGQEMVEKNT